MSEGRILYTSAEVRKSIIQLFTISKGRRVAITAFVGKGAEAYLPKPNGLELVCWPKAGGTNPFALRRLIKRGVEVSFVDSLHMKVYWTEDKGVIVTSANLSTNALGAGNLQEFGVFLPAGYIDIDKILARLALRPASNRELLQLDKLHHEYETRVGPSRIGRRGISFSEWYRLPYRPTWKLGWWDEYGSVSLSAKEVAQEEYGIVAPYEFMSCRRNDYKKNDWILAFHLSDKAISRISWIPVDYVVPVAKWDKKAYAPAYPYQAVQVWPLSRYPVPPFRIDKRFRYAFSKVLREFGIARVKEIELIKPAKRFVDSIYSNY